MATRATHLAEPGMYHGPIEGSPQAGDAILDNCVPVVRVSLGTIAGRDVTLTVADMGWLDDLEVAAQDARARLAMFGVGTPAAAA